MINILCTKDADELAKIHSLLREYFKSYEVVSYRDFVYYAQNFASLYEGEDYIVYKIETAAKLIGMLSCVKLNEFVLIDYLVIDVEHRYYSQRLQTSDNRRSRVRGTVQIISNVWFQEVQRTVQIHNS